MLLGLQAALDLTFHACIALHNCTMQEQQIRGVCAAGLPGAAAGREDGRQSA